MELSTESPIRPALRGETIRPGDVHEVSTAVRLAADGGLDVAVRGGGHSFAGLSTTGTGVVIDLSRLDQVRVVDEEHHLVRVGGGATWGQVGDVLGPKGLAISSGDTRSVGVGGLTLSGGIGWKVRKHGLALDCLRAAQVVTADGAVLRASSEENPELFWAIRGGGGNVGVVTEFEFAAHPTTDVFFGKITFPAEQARAVLDGWTRYLRRAPAELSSIANLANPMTGGASAPVELHVCWDGDDEGEADQGLAPLRTLGTVLEDDVAKRPWADVLEEGGPMPDGFRVAVRSAFVAPTRTPAVLDELVEIAESGAAPFISIRALGGAVEQVPDDATAYAHRSAELLILTLAAGPAAYVEEGRSARAELWRGLEPHLSGAYANFLDSATQEDVRAVYPPSHYARLASAKRRYDPANLFAGNHNVPPDGDHGERLSA